MYLALPAVLWSLRLMARLVGLRRAQELNACNGLCFDNIVQRQRDLQMKKILSTLVATVAIAGGSAMAGDGPAPLSLTELDTVSAAGTSAGTYGGSSLYASDCYCGGLSIDVYNHNDAYAHGYTLEAADAAQQSGIEAGSIGGYPIWGAYASQGSSAGAVSYYPHYYAYGIPVLY